jgi:uncharacterized membrane protein YcaP (DUF421 family)
METHELLMTALRALGVYIIVLIVIRMSGKRTIGNFTAFDLLVALMLGEVVDEIIYGDVSLAQGGVSIAVIALAQQVNAWLSFHYEGFNRIVEGASTVIVRDGELDRRGMLKERMHEHDVMAELRLSGVHDMREVRLATVENDGQVSVLLQDWAEPLKKKDIERRKGAAKASASRRQPTDPGPAPPQKRSDSQEALG